MEIFKSIEDYPNYEISNMGRVKNIKFNKFMTPISDGYYMNIVLSKDGKQKTHRVHKLVALYFCENPNDYTCVDHINLDKLDNRSENLRWVSFSSNMYNQRKRTPQSCTSIYKGVAKTKNNKFVAYITVDKKRFYLGRFDSEINAALEYNKNAIILLKDNIYYLNDI
jgi:hypothetical protein